MKTKLITISIVIMAVVVLAATSKTETDSTSVVSQLNSQTDHKPNQKLEKIESLYLHLKTVNQQIDQLSARRSQLFNQVKDMRFEDITAESKIIFDELNELDEERIRLNEELIQSIQAMRKS